MFLNIWQFHRVRSLADELEGDRCCRTRTQTDERPPLGQLSYCPPGESPSYLPPKIEENLVNLRQRGHKTSHLCYKTSLTTVRYRRRPESSIRSQRRDFRGIYPDVRPQRATGAAPRLQPDPVAVLSSDRLCFLVNARLLAVGLAGLVLLLHERLSPAYGGHGDSRCLS